MLRSNLCDYSDAYNVFKGTITVEGTNNIVRKNRFLAFKNNTPFISCISKINGVPIENAEDLDVIMPMYLTFLSIAKVTQRHLVLYGIITEMH